MPSHYEESMQRDADRIRDKIAAMAVLAQGALEGALRALLTRNRQLAYTVILRDRRIDELEKEIDRLCLEFIVRQQPVAKHLRFAYIAIKINQEIERIGDYAESIARQGLKLSDTDIDLSKLRFEAIAALSVSMLRDAVRSFIEQDADLARRTMPVEEEVDSLKSSINAELFQLQVDRKIPLEALRPLQTIARRFERVSDQAKNICEEVMYMATGEYSKHIGGEVWRMLFVDDHNACASQMAEAIGHSLAQPQFVFASAGLEAGTIDGGIVEFLRRKEIDISRAIPRSIEQIPNLEFVHIIVALSPNARRAFSFSRKAVWLDWSELIDPCAPGFPAENKNAAFEVLYRFLHEHIADLCKAVLADEID